MKYIGYLFLLVQLSACSECDYSVPPNTRTLFSFYQPSDTLFFSTRTGTDIDTLVITSIDSTEFCGRTFKTAKGKTIDVVIKHLPKNYKGWTEHLENGKIRIHNQQLFSLVKIIRSSGEQVYDFWVHYRNFSQPLYLDSLSTGERLKDLGIYKYWKIPNTWYDPKQNPNDVMEILWTREYGLTEYTKRNGDTLRINMP